MSLDRVAAGRTLAVGRQVVALVRDALVSATGRGSATVASVLAELVADTSVYGVLGAVLLLVTWFYVGSLALLAGAMLNAVLADAAETGNDKAPPADTTPNERQ